MARQKTELDSLKTSKHAVDGIVKAIEDSDLHLDLKLPAEQDAQVKMHKYVTAVQEPAASRQER